MEVRLARECGVDRCFFSRLQDHCPGVGEGRAVRFFGATGSVRAKAIARSRRRLFTIVWSPSVVGYVVSSCVLLTLFCFFVALHFVFL